MAAIWYHSIARCGLLWCCLRDIAAAVELWLGGPFLRCGRSLWRVVPFGISWSIWKERNNRIFRVTSSILVDMISRVTFRIAKWSLIRKEFSNVNLDNILFNWEASMRYSWIKERRLVHWSFLSMGVLKFNVDGARWR